MTLQLPERDPCPFCANVQGSNGCVFVRRDDRVASFVNPGQHQPGSLLVIPVEHYTSVVDIPGDLVRDVYSHAHELSRAVLEAFQATGVNVFQNNGVEAGQSVPHFHVHVVPRYPGGDPTQVFSERTAARIDSPERQRIADSVRRFLT